MRESILTKQSFRLFGKGFSANALKMIALITMIVDHFSAVIYLFLHNGGYTVEWGMEFEHSLNLYYIMRNIGRFAFPIFSFFIVEGYFHTKSRFKYMRNLLIFALISEVPYDFYFMGEPFYWGQQNVFFTLAIALGAVWLIDIVRQKLFFSVILRVLLQVLIIAGMTVLARVLVTDYTCFGVWLAVIFYYYRDTRLLGCIMATIIFCSLVPWGFPAFIALLFYNGERGKNMKYFYYIFYPAHLILLGIVRILGGI